MESGEVLHQSFSQSWASLNREAVEEAGKLGEVRGYCLVAFLVPVRPTDFPQNADGSPLVSSVLHAYLICSDNVLDAVWGPEV